MSNFWKRTLFGGLFVGIVIGSVLGGEISLLLLLSVITVLGLLELYTLCEKDAIYPQKVSGLILGISPFLVALFPHCLKNESGMYAIAFIFIFFFCMFIFELFRKKEKPFANIALTIFGVLYISVTLFAFYLISIYPVTGDWFWDKWNYNSRIPLGYFFILWSYDTGAYLAGSQFGKHKLWERLSPKKTWEGVAGGAVVALGVAHFISRSFTALSRMDWLVITIIIMVTGTLGDLFKSMFKRSINVKDSGNIIPGHGGILDRFDALLLSAPFVLCYLFLSR